MTRAVRLEFDQVSAGYDERPALHRVSFRADPGEVVALTGPNGSGKTTLLRAALGLLALQGGRVSIGGRSTERLSIRERARWFGWMPQSEPLRENIRVHQYVLYGRHPWIGPWESEGPEDLQAVDRALAAVDLSVAPDRGVLELSGGERQRALMARVLASEAPFLLLDEPTAHLDIGHQIDLLERVRSLCHREQMVALVALHDLNLAARFADRIVTLHRGRLVADGPVASILSPELLREVWGIVAELRHDPATGLPYLLPTLPGPMNRANPPEFEGVIHIVGGGGAARELLQRLHDEGFLLSLGAVHLFDSDTERARDLGIPTVVETPFAPLSEAVRERHRGLIVSSRAVVVAPFAVGPGNLANLEDLADTIGSRSVALFEPAGLPPRDFTGGRAERLIQELRGRGAVSLASLDEVVRWVDRVVSVREPDRAPGRPAREGGPSPEPNSDR
ncbi:MAG: ABC transporter ATP-binding protein [Thermoplasmata archaeon]